MTNSTVQELRNTLSTITNLPALNAICAKVGASSGGDVTQAQKQIREKLEGDDPEKELTFNIEKLVARYEKTAPKEEKKNNRTAIILIVLATFILVFGCVWFFGWGPGSEWDFNPPVSVEEAAPAEPAAEEPADEKPTTWLSTSGKAPIAAAIKACETASTKEYLDEKNNVLYPCTAVRAYVAAEKKAAEEKAAADKKAAAQPAGPLPAAALPVSAKSDGPVLVDFVLLQDDFGVSGPAPRLLADPSETAAPASKTLGEMIETFDNELVDAKIAHDNAGWFTTCTDGGLYYGTTVIGQSNLIPWVVSSGEEDGTPGFGIYLYETSGHFIESPGGEICLDNFEGDVTRLEVVIPSDVLEVSAPSCVAKSKVDGVFASYGDDPEALIGALDSLAALNKDARALASQPGVYKGVADGEVIGWTSGDVENATLLASSPSGKNVYESTGGDMRFSFMFNSLTVCQ
ncbi:hypothetical protein ACFL1A_02070 [Patescibacteria group bacterium]